MLYLIFPWKPTRILKKEQKSKVCVCLLHLVIDSHQRSKVALSAFPWRECHVAAAQQSARIPAAEMGTPQRPGGGGKHWSGSVSSPTASTSLYDPFTSQSVSQSPVSVTASLSLCSVLLGIEVKFKNMVYPVILAPAFIPELNTVTHSDDGEYRHKETQIWSFKFDG